MRRNETDGSSEPSETTHRKRRRRWLLGLWVLGLLAVLVLAAVAAAPYVLSTPTAEGWLSSAASRGIRGSVHVEGLSLGWFSPARVGHVELRDVQDRVVAEVRDLSLGRGLMRWLGEPKRFGEVAIEDVHLRLIPGADGRPTLADAVEPVEPRVEPREPFRWPELDGSVTVKSFRVDVHSPDGRVRSFVGPSENALVAAFEAAQGGRVDLDTGLSLQGGRTAARLDASVTNLDRLAEVAVLDLPGRSKVTATIDGGEIRELLGWLGMDPPVRFARAEMSLDADFQGGTGQLACSLDVRDLSGAASEIEPVPLEHVSMRIRARNRGESGGDDVQFELGLLAGGSSLALTGRFRAGVGSWPPAGRGVGEAVLAALLRGETGGWPRYELSLAGRENRILPAEILAAFPSLSARGSGRATGGRIDIDGLELTGGENPRAVLAVRMNEMQATIDGERRTLPPAVVDVDARIEPGAGLRIESMKLDSDVARLTGSGHANEMQLSLRADGTKLREAVGGLFAWAESLPRGRIEAEMSVRDGLSDRPELTWNARLAEIRFRRGAREYEVPAASTDAKVSLELSRGRLASVTADTLAIEAAGLRRDGRAMLEGPVRVNGESIGLRPAAAAGPAGRLEIGSLDVILEMVQARLSGTVETREPWRMDLRGNYRGDLEALTALLHEFAPATRGQIAASGTSEGQFAIRGPARREGLRPAFREVTAEAPIRWGVLETWGLNLAGGRLSPRLAEGVLEIPPAAVDASGGVARLAGRVDFTGEVPVYELAGETALLEKVPITPDLGRALLSRVNPIFAEAAELSGTVSLSAKDLRLPLDAERILRGGSGSGRLTLEDLRFRPRGLLAELLSLAGRLRGAERRMGMRVRGVDFRIAGGRLHYENLALLMSEESDEADMIELGFRGSVGFDDTLDLAVSMPVRAALLERFGATGPVLEYARLLEGARIELPLRGTRLQPRLDFSKVDIRPLIQKAATQLAAERAGDLLGGVLNRRNQTPDGAGSEDAENGGGESDQLPDAPPRGEEPSEREGDRTGRPGGDAAREALRPLLDALLRRALESGSNERSE